MESGGNWQPADINPTQATRIKDRNNRRTYGGEEICRGGWVSRKRPTVANQSVGATRRFREEKGTQLEKGKHSRLVEWATM